MFPGSPFYIFLETLITINKNFTMKNSGLISFNVSALFIFLFTTLLISNSSGAQEGVCKNVSCGQGTCTPVFLGFDCECFPGWKKIQVGPLIYPSCAIPNCTIDLQCGDKSVAPLPPPPPPPYSPPPVNLTSPCLLVWCGDGTCMPKDSGYYCQCNKGSGNLFGSPIMACFKQCSFQGDCKNITIGPPGNAPAPSLAHKKGWNEVSYWSRIVLVLTLALSTMTFATWTV